MYYLTILIIWPFPFASFTFLNSQTAPPPPLGAIPNHIAKKTSLNTTLDSSGYYISLDTRQTQKLIQGSTSHTSIFAAINRILFTADKMENGRNQLQCLVLLCALVHSVSKARQLKRMFRFLLPPFLFSISVSFVRFYRISRIILRLCLLKFLRSQNLKGDTGVDKKVILKWALEKSDLKACTVFMWLGILTLVNTVQTDYFLHVRDVPLYSIFFRIWRMNNNK
jgi:hypothetical protein